MGRAPCCDKNNVKKGPWSPEEDAKLKEFIDKHGTGGNWIALPQKAGLRRCGKSCRLRWLNYLRPNIKHGEFTEHEDRVICGMYASIGSRWSIIASQLPGRTDNDIKNYWNTKLKKKLLSSAAAAAPLPRPPRQQQHHHHHRPLLLPHSHSPSLPPHHPSSYKYNGFFTGAGSLQQEPGLIPTLTLPTTTTTHDYMLMSSGSSLLPMANVSALLNNTPQLQVKEEVCSSMIVFGSDQQSCSSSDNGQFGHHGHGKELSFGNGYSYGGCYSGGILEHHHRLLQQEQEQEQLDYSYEEMKQLLMTTSTAAAAELQEQEAMEAAGLIGSNSQSQAQQGKQVSMM